MFAYFFLLNTKWSKLSTNLISRWWRYDCPDVGGHRHIKAIQTDFCLRRNVDCAFCHLRPIPECLKASPCGSSPCLRPSIWRTEALNKQPPLPSLPIHFPVRQRWQAPRELATQLAPQYHTRQLYHLHFWRLWAIIAPTRGGSPSCFPRAEPGEDNILLCLCTCFSARCEKV